jgi:phosphoglycolate phosphatase
MSARPDATAAAPLDLVIFDLDGTLADTVADIARALNATLADSGLPALPVETVVGYVGDGSAKLIERALPPGASRGDVAALLDRFLAHYEAEPCVDSRLYPGITELLAALTAAKVKTALLTNKSGAVTRRLLEVILPDHRFIAVIGDRDGFPRKPDPTAGQAIIARAGTTADRTAVLGDGIPDMHLAHALGARAVAAAWGYTARDRLAAESPAAIAATPIAAGDLLLASARS